MEQFPDELGQAGSYVDGLVGLVVKEAEYLLGTGHGLKSIIRYIRDVSRLMQFERKDFQHDHIVADMEKIERDTPNLNTRLELLQQHIEGYMGNKAQSVVSEVLSEFYDPVIHRLEEGFLSKLSQLRLKLEDIVKPASLNAAVSQSATNGSPFDIQITPVPEGIQSIVPEVDSSKFLNLELPTLLDEDALWTHFEVDSSIQFANLLDKSAFTEKFKECLERGTQLSYNDDISRTVQRRKFVGVPRSMTFNGEEGVRALMLPNDSEAYYVVEDYGLELAFLNGVKELEAKASKLGSEHDIHYLHQKMRHLVSSISQPPEQHKVYLFTPASLLGIGSPLTETYNEEYPLEVLYLSASDAIIQYTRESGWYVQRQPGAAEATLHLGRSFYEATEAFARNSDAIHRAENFLNMILNAQ
jgi:hypothetical protein